MWGRFPTFFCSERLPRRDVKDSLEDVVGSELDAVGFDLVELRRGGTRSRPLIELRIDRRDGVAVTVDDCARASRAVEARLDGSDLVSPQYTLQVSSPGERPLRTVAEWQRFVGRWANVLSPEHGGRFEGKIIAVEGSTGAEVVVIEPKAGDQRSIPLSAVKEARLAFHF
ncbi:MAG: ribosome maturation factor RimP [Gemmatimonadaceae bacterium]